MKHIITFLALVAVVAVQLPGAGGEQLAEKAKERIQQAREWFLQSERVARLTDREQEKHVRAVYTELWPKVLRAQVAWGRLSFFGRMGAKDRAKLTPEELADAILKSYKTAPGLIENAALNCMSILRKHPAALKPLVQADFRSGDDVRIEKALRIVGDLRLAAFFDAALAVFQKNKNLSGRAAYTLRDIGDARAIRALIEKDPKPPMAHFELLRSLQRKNPPDPLLLKLLRSTDAEVRWRAAYALSESGHTSLVPEVRKLAKDTDHRVRKNAANIGFSIEGRDFANVRPTLVLLLSDENRKVRCFTAWCFAERKDKVCAPVLLELLRDGTMEEGWHSNVVQAVHSLTGDYFGYHIGSDAWQPTTKKNQAAIARFAEWIKKNAPGGPPKKGSK